MIAFVDGSEVGEIPIIGDLVAGESVHFPGCHGACSPDASAGTIDTISVITARVVRRPVDDKYGTGLQFASEADFEVAHRYYWGYVSASRISRYQKGSVEPRLKWCAKPTKLI